MRKTNERLYGKDVEVPKVPEYVVMRKIELLNDNLDSIMETKGIDRDRKQCKEIKDSIEFWSHINDKDS